MSYEDFKAHLARNPIVLSPIEQQAVMMAQQQAAQYAVGLGNRVDQVTGHLMIEADAEQRRRLRDIIKTGTAENVAKRESVKKLKSDLGWATKDWARDWDRIAVTEKHRAMTRGVVDDYANRFGGDVRVAIRSMPDCCKDCQKLTVGPDGQPLIFKLSDLEANGTNFGKKRELWLVVVPPIHPNCVCQVIRVPKGWGFNEEGQLVPGGELGVEGDVEKSLSVVELELADASTLKKARPKLKRIRYQGLTVVVENPKGSVRKWKTDTGEIGETVMTWPYGYLEGTLGADGDELDVFVGPDPKASMAYVVHQQEPKSGVYDEDKVMLGWPDVASARAAYLDNYNRTDFLVTISEVAVNQLLSVYGAPIDDDGSTKLVIPAPELKKARIAKELVAPGPDLSPGPGVGVNVAFDLPRGDRHPMAECARVALDELQSQRSRDVVKRDKEVYELGAPLLVIARPVVIPDGERRPLEGEVEARKEALDADWERNQGITNRVDIGDRGKLVRRQRDKIPVLAKLPERE